MNRNVSRHTAFTFHGLLLDNRYSFLYITLMKPGARMMARKSASKRPLPVHAYRVRGHIWIEGVEGTFLGLGRIMLLERIGALGSIRRAAASIRMSYRRAWELVDSMNTQAASPLVVAAVGGRGGGGASLTEAGVEAVALFRRMELEFEIFAERQSKGVAAFRKA